MNKDLIKKVIKKIDKVLFREKLRNFYSNEIRRSTGRRMQRRLVSHKSDLYNSGFFFYYAKNENSQINKLCDHYGTDKGESNKENNPYWWESHNYADLYEMLFRCSRKHIKLLIECGLGTNDTNIKCSMGKNGKPGASLRMWRDFFPNARIIGVDIDKKILFNEERIETFYCDQLNKKSIENFSKESNLIKNSADIILDDGLHTFKAGVSFFENMIKFLNEDGTYIIEDVRPRDMILYKDYFENFRKEFTVHFIEGKRPNIPYSEGNKLILILKNNLL